MNWDVIVIGAGAAGLLAATHAAERGRRTLLLEKNRRAGAKLLLSGGTRCNLTHATDARGIVEAFGRPGKFLHSALAALSPQDLVALVEAEGVPTKTEPGGKIFPASNQSRDVLHALLRRFRRSGGTLLTDTPVRSLSRGGAGFLLATPAQEISSPRVILTTGGSSYPRCGTTGDGYRFGEELGHTISPLRPALVPLTSSAAWVRELQGRALPEVELRLVERAVPGSRERARARRRGSMLFTHFGISGPVVLDLSREVSGQSDPRRLRLECNLLPDLAEREVRDFLRESAASHGRKQVSTILGERVPRQLGLALLGLAGVSRERRLAELRGEEVARLVQALQAQEIPVTGTLGFEKAEVTAGGVCLDEMDSRSLESKLVPGLYFAGEVLDLDGPLGGYNFQAAFSTGWLAGGQA